MFEVLKPIFAKYEQLRNDADRIFQQVSAQFPNCVKCIKGCDSCCYALFDLSLVEAMYINQAFKDRFDYGPIRSKILEKAADTDRKLTKIKRDLFKKEKNGLPQAEIMQEAASLRMQCPLLAENQSCLLYNDRPITCRVYGIPTVFGLKAHVCGQSAFEPGVSYPTLHLDKIQAKLEAMSAEIATVCKSRFTELDQVYVPLSMALLTTYDERYLGIGNQKEDLDG